MESVVLLWLTFLRDNHNRDSINESLVKREYCFEIIKLEVLFSRNP